MVITTKLRVHMKGDYEYFLFAKELGRLLLDFDMCDDEEIKKEIVNDIRLLESALQCSGYRNSCPIN
ncbi:hypothetical protein [Peribacillus sp. SCS-155]|uniref:hypothetical protein n=1 Tax=Peribacillus sedimenti TaxID=3115297 RepID=UPI0039069318